MGCLRAPPRRLIPLFYQSFVACVFFVTSRRTVLRALFLLCLCCAVPLRRLCLSRRLFLRLCFVGWDRERQGGMRAPGSCRASPSELFLLVHGAYAMTSFDGTYGEEVLGKVVVSYVALLVLALCRFLVSFDVGSLSLKRVVTHDEDQSVVPCWTQVTTFRVECVGVGVMRQAVARCCSCAVHAPTLPWLSANGISSTNEEYPFPLTPRSQSLTFKTTLSGSGTKCGVVRGLWNCVLQ